MPHFLPPTLPNFKQARVLVVGDIMLDRYWFGETSRISPEAPVPIVKIESRDHRPGGAGNVALNISSLGAQTILLGITGEDDAGLWLTQQLTAANIKHDLCQLKNVSTIIKLRVMSRRQQLLRMDFEENIAAINKQEMFARFQKYVKEVDLVILSDYHKGTLSDPQSLIQYARSLNVPVIVDPKSHDFSIYRHATLLTPNYKEFSAVVGCCRDENEMLEKGRRLLSDYQIENLLVTRGEQGMTLIQAANSLHLPAYAREVLDVTGAGDSVISTLGTALASGMTMTSATALANLAASIAISKLGAVAVSAPEMQAALAKKTLFTSGVVNDEQLLQSVQQARMEGKRIVFTNGCFDILHAGHVTCLQMAKQLGDYLIVGVNTDESIRKLKGPERPINHLEHRMTVLAGLGVVDWVVPFADETPERLLKLLRPDVLVKGGEYDEDQVVGADIVRAYGGEIRILGSKIDSSSHIIERIIKRLPEDLS